MATIRAYTTIEQSRKLAEILPLESADMVYFYWINSRTKKEGIDDIPTIRGELPIQKCDIPCWSLAALLHVLPLEIETHKQTDGHKICYYVELYMKHMGKEIYLSTERHENMIDACVEIVLKLRELNLL